MESQTPGGSSYLDERHLSGDQSFMEARRAPGTAGTAAGDGGAQALAPRAGETLAQAASAIEPPSVPDGTFVKVADGAHPLPRACEVAVYFQDYHRSSSKLGRFGKIVGIDAEGGEYLVMLDNFECLAVPMRRVEWRKVAT
jgi:hypothetical protein